MSGEKKTYLTAAGLLSVKVRWLYCSNQDNQKTSQERGGTLPSKTSQVNKNLNREHKFNDRNGEINTYPMVQNCIRKLPKKK